MDSVLIDGLPDMELHSTQIENFVTPARNFGDRPTAVATGLRSTAHMSSKLAGVGGTPFLVDIPVVEDLAAAWLAS